MDEFAVPHVNTRVITPAGMAEGHNVTGAHIFLILNALAHRGLLPRGARQLHAHAFVGPADKARAVKTARTGPAPHIGGPDGRTGLAQQLPAGLGLVFVQSRLIGTAEALHTHILIGGILFGRAPESQAAAHNQRTQFQIFTHSHSIPSMLRLKLPRNGEVNSPCDNFAARIL